MKVMNKICNLQEKNPLFREFCKIHNLKDGDLYSAVDYIEYCDGLTMCQSIEIVRKYLPDFKMEGCNL